MLPCASFNYRKHSSSDQTRTIRVYIPPLCGLRIPKAFLVFVVYEYHI